MKDLIIVSLAGIMGMVVGIFVLINGILGLTNVLTIALGSIFEVVGFYVLVRSGMEMMK